MILEKRALKGKVAIVTGGGTGLGKAMALTLAKAGADIVVAARRAEPLEQTVKEIRHLGVRAFPVPTDVTDSQQVNWMVERTLLEMGKIDILINVAGGGEGLKPIEDVTDEQWYRVIETNLSSVFLCCRAVGKHFLAQKSGKVINISAGGGVRGARNNYAYCSAKAGVISFTYSLALSWARDNIQVNCIAPGFFDTHALPAEELQQRAQFIAVGRTGIVHEVGLLALFLASDASGYVTGQMFIIDGGALAGGYAPTGYAPIVAMKED